MTNSEIDAPAGASPRGRSRWSCDRDLGPPRPRGSAPAPLVVRGLDQPRRAQHRRVHRHVELAPRQRRDPQRRREPRGRRAVRERRRPGGGREAAPGGLQGPVGRRDRRPAAGVVPDRRPRARAAGLPGALQGGARGVAHDARAGARGRRRPGLDRRGRGDLDLRRDHHRGRPTESGSATRSSTGFPADAGQIVDPPFRRARHGAERLPAAEDARLGAAPPDARRVRARGLALARPSPGDTRNRLGRRRRRAPRSRRRSPDARTTSSTRSSSGATTGKQRATPGTSSPSSCAARSG